MGPIDLPHRGIGVTHTIIYPCFICLDVQELFVELQSHPESEAFFQKLADDIIGTDGLLNRGMFFRD